MTKANREEMLGEIRSRLWELIEKDMAKLYFKLTDDALLIELVRIKVITEEEFEEVVESAFLNVSTHISENPDLY